MKKNPLLSVRSAADLLGTTKWLLWHHSQDWGLTTYYTPGGGVSSAGRTKRSWRWPSNGRSGRRRRPGRFLGFRRRQSNFVYIRSIK